MRGRIICNINFLQFAGYRIHIRTQIEATLLDQKIHGGASAPRFQGGCMLTPMGGPYLIHPHTASSGVEAQTVATSSMSRRQTLPHTVQGVQLYWTAARGRFGWGKPNSCSRQGLCFHTSSHYASRCIPVQMSSFPP